MMAVIVIASFFLLAAFPTIGNADERVKVFSFVAACCGAIFLIFAGYLTDRINLTLKAQLYKVKKDETSEQLLLVGTIEIENRGFINVSCTSAELSLVGIPDWQPEKKWNRDTLRLTREYGGLRGWYGLNWGTKESRQFYFAVPSRPFYHIEAKFKIRTPLTLFGYGLLYASAVVPNGPMLAGSPSIENKEAKTPSDESRASISLPLPPGIAETVTLKEDK
jgi:hypothetical protein